VSRPDPVVFYRYLRLLLAVAALLLILFAGIRALADGASPSDIGAVVVILVVFAIVGLRYVQRTRGMQDQAAYAELARASLARRAEKRRAEWVMGAECAACKRRIVIEEDGVVCPTCRAPVHVDCVGDHRAQAHASSSYRA
jgi:hypothetical protein